MRHRALAAEVRHRDDRAAAAGLHERLRRPRAGHERVRADVDRQPEAVARRVREPALEILGRGERDGVDEEVETAVERLGHLREDARHVVVGAHVALGDERARDALRQLPHSALDALALVREGELGALVREPPRDRPGDRPLVGDPEHEPLLAGEQLMP